MTNEELFSVCLHFHAEASHSTTHILWIGQGGPTLLLRYSMMWIIGLASGRSCLNATYT